jgi:hypothetical protein
MSNADMTRAEKERVDKELATRQASPLMLGLAKHLRACWDAAKTAKNPIDNIMLRGMRQRNGEYEADKLRSIREMGGSEIFMMLTEVKCRAAESWLRDILLDEGTPPWDITPTPVPDLPTSVKDFAEQLVAESVMSLIEAAGQAPSAEQINEIREVVLQQQRFKRLQAAQNRVDMMRYEMQDQFAEGGWSEAFDDFITDLVTFPAAFVKGPVIRRQRRLEWALDEFGSTIAKAGDRIAPEFERVDPFKVYPEPGISNINDGYIFEHHELSRSELADLIDVPGYDSAAIRKLLEDGGYNSWVSETTERQREEQERKFYSYESPNQTYDALEFWGKVSGKMLLDWGLTEEEVDEPSREYDANVWLVGNFVIKATLNYDPLGEKPYAKASFIKVPGAFWGKGIPEIMEDIQSVCNASARALVNNMGIASGPQVEVNVERLPPNEDIEQIHPWKIWQVMNDPMGSSAPAVRFNQPTDNAATLMAVYDKFSKLADDHTGIPSYVYGDLNVSGAGRTSSGLSMLMGAAGKSIRQVVMHIDASIIKPIVHRLYVYNMRYNENEAIKGDVQVVAKGAINLAVKETVNVRRVEFMNATANEFDMAIMGEEGRAAILREVAKGLQMPAEDIVPSREKLGGMKRMMQAQAAAQGNQPNPAPLNPDGSPVGGGDGNIVSNKDTGAA